MPVSPEYLDYIIDQLKAFGPVTAKRMFSGAGLYHQGLFFGIIADDVLYFKVDDGNRQDYIDAGMGPFKPFGSYAMGYYDVPADVLEDSHELALWARKAFEAVGKKIKKKAKGKTDKKAGKKR
jgi:DNA transformation protein